MSNRPYLSTTMTPPAYDTQPIIQTIEGLFESIRNHGRDALPYKSPRRTVNGPHSRPKVSYRVHATLENRLITVIIRLKSNVFADEPGDFAYSDRKFPFALLTNELKQQFPDESFPTRDEWAFSRNHPIAPDVTRYSLAVEVDLFSITEG